MNSESAREARRRKILERGSARLAFITGEARSLPPSAVDHPDPLPPADVRVSAEEEIHVAETPIEQELTDSGATFASFPEHNKLPEFLSEITRDIEPEATDNYFDHPVTNRGPESRESLTYIFTARSVSSSISASENIRLLCAISIAILTILSCCDSAVNSDSLWRIFSFRPIYTVMFTDLALLLGMIYTNGWKMREEGLSERNGAQESGEWFDQMGKALEVVIILQKVAGAVLADSCLCAVIIVCSISFCRSF